MRIFLTGGTGFLGSNIVRVATTRYGAEVGTTVHSHTPAPNAGYRWWRIDMLDAPALAAQVRAERPDAVVHSAIARGLDAMYADRRRAWDAYVGVTRTLADAANDVGAQLVLVSTDWVFDGTQAGATEDTPPNPVNLYGVLKLAAEMVVQERAHSWAVARVAGVNGVHWERPDFTYPQDAGFGYFVTGIVRSLRAGRSYQVWDGDINIVATPSLASDCADLIMRIVTRRVGGVFHCCGAESIGRFELARAAAAAFDLDEALLRRVPAPPSATALGSIPRDTSLDAGATAATLGRGLLSVADQLAGLRRELTELAG